MFANGTVTKYSLSPLVIAMVHGSYVMLYLHTGDMFRNHVAKLMAKMEKTAVTSETLVNHGQKGQNM